MMPVSSTPVTRIKGESTREYPVAIYGIILLVFLYIVGYLIPVNLTWGFNAFGFLPGLCLFAGIVIILAAVVGGSRGWFGPPVSAIHRFSERFPLRFLFIVCGIVVLAGILLRVKIPLLGDSFFIVKNFSDVIHGTGTLLLRNEPLATIYFVSIQTLINPSTYAGFLYGFLAAGLFLAVIYTVAADLITRSLFPAVAERIPAFLLLLSLPTLQLFFGYVEVYAEVTVVIALYILAAISNIRGKISFAIVPSVFLLAVGSHYVSLFLFPSLLYLGILAIRRGNGRSVITGSLVAAGAVCFALYLIGFDLSRVVATVPHSHFLPLTAPSDPVERYSSSYTLISGGHFLDLMNQAVLLLGPLTVLLLTTVRRSGSTGRPGNQEIFLWLAAIPVVLLGVVIKYDLGAAKDWDVLAAYSPVVAMATLVTFFRRGGSRKIPVLSLVCIAALIQTMSYCLLNSTTEPALRRYQTFFNSATLSNAAWYTSALHLAYYYHQIHDEAGPVTVWNGYLNAFPDDPRGYQNLITGLGYCLPRDDERIDTLYDRWHALQKQDTAVVRMQTTFRLNVAGVNFANGHLREAIAWYRKALDLSPGNSEALGGIETVRKLMGTDVAPSRHSPQEVPVR